MRRVRSYGSLQEFLAATSTTQEALAQRVGTKQSVISRAAHGQPVGRKLALRLHQATGVPLAALLYPDLSASA